MGEQRLAWMVDRDKLVNNSSSFLNYSSTNSSASVPHQPIRPLSVATKTSYSKDVSPNQTLPGASKSSR
ncbi:hypothetical protein PspLS_07015 [Pyricularia sp. CBS 133598]|nr:hypothetical protein PspLS_07015 [Pyricularia sp. CBS 133598]